MASAFNSTTLYSNMTQMSVTNSNKVIDSIKIFMMFLMLSSFCFFVYFISVLLRVYFTTSHVQENSRYILFVHMLINDTLNLTIGLFLFLCSYFMLYIPAPICIIILTLAASSFRVTPYSLAAMSLERYVAICHPLRHVEFCTAQRSHVAIATMWVVSLIFPVADVIALIATVPKSFYSQCVMCQRNRLTISQLQVSMRSFSLISSLVLVALVIIYTYIKIMVVALKIGSGNSSAFKAGKTVMLHGFQLLLSISSFASSLTETYFRESTVLLLPNFIVFTYLPRLLSPLIYGIRDEVFNKCIKKMYYSKP
ncbi:odorant receptor 131-2-like [Bombina bombina]|uniref:odorant receptor 131-2-like n=1 Tax=Bombina bombina TaxID=8345 RepID=UPI00235A928A|nr:odorant receptor 131-2-like [Bombina bombina]